MIELHFKMTYFLFFSMCFALGFLFLKKKSSEDYHLFSFSVTYFEVKESYRTYLGTW